MLAKNANITSRRLGDPRLFSEGRKSVALVSSVTFFDANRAEVVDLLSEKNRRDLLAEDRRLGVVLVDEAILTEFVRCTGHVRRRRKMIHVFRTMTMTKGTTQYEMSLRYSNTYIMK